MLLHLYISSPCGTHLAYSGHLKHATQRARLNNAAEFEVIMYRVIYAFLHFTCQPVLYPSPLQYLRYSYSTVCACRRACLNLNESGCSARLIIVRSLVCSIQSPQIAPPFSAQPHTSHRQICNQIELIPSHRTLINYNETPRVKPSVLLTTA